MIDFVVGYIDWFNNELTLEQIKAETWQEAVQKHTKYPFSTDDYILSKLTCPETFKQECFNCDCMMSWIEVSHDSSS